jgi:peptidyl-prolyl cis-trans isomerase C
MGVIAAAFCSKQIDEPLYFDFLRKLIVQLLTKLIRGLVILLVFAAAACGSGTAPTTAPELNDPPATTVPETPDPSLTTAAAPVTSTAPPTSAPEVNAPPVAPTSGVPVGDNGEPLVARVNGEGITVPEFEQALARRQLEFNASDPGALRAEVLDQLIEQVVLEQGAAAQQITVSDAEVQAELQSNVELAGSEEAWAQWLATNAYTPDEFLVTLRATLLTNRVRDSLTADLTGTIRQVHARHILLRTEAEANDVLARMQGGEDFATLASTMSNDETTREQGGDLGWFTAEELLVPELAQAAFALEPGGIGGPVGTELGYHVIQTLEIADRPVDPEERRVFIAQARFENWLRPLMQNAIIERYIS